MEKSKEKSEEILNNNFFRVILKCKEFFGGVTSLGIYLGGGLIFVYLFFYINYIPPSLSIGDSLSYLFVFLGFGFFYILFVLLNVLVVLFSFPDLHCKYLGSNLFISCILIILGLNIFIFVFYLVFSNYIVPTFVLLALFFLYLCVIYFFLFDFDNREYKNNFSFSLVVLFFPFIFFNISGSIVDYTLNRLGIKSDNVSIRLNDNDFLFVNNMLNDNDEYLKTSCDIFSKSNVVHDVNVLWGVGKESFIEIEGVRLTINNDNLNYVKVPHPRKCVFKKFKGIFEEGSYVVNDNYSVGRVNKFIEKYKKIGIKEITIYGIADLKSYNDGGNEKLSEKRAKYIKEKLRKDMIKDTPLQSKALSNLEYNPYCKNKSLDKIDLKYCEGINRGVIVRLEIK